MAKRHKRNRRVGVLDFETDPFLPGRVPYPFAACIYFNDDEYGIAWEPNIIEKLIKSLRALPHCILYAHNGGKFDFHYLIEYANPGTIVIRNGRIFQMQLGKCILKDSFPLMPFALSEYQKTKIDYAIFESDRRNIPHNAKQIREYLLDDCRYLLDLIKGFKQVVGNKDTIASAAFSQMRKLNIKIWRGNEQHDALFRPYFFGGRVEAFKRGVFDGRFLYLDVNSAYSYAMQFQHPHGADYVSTRALPRLESLGPCFARIVATSRGALPMRDDDGKLAFPFTMGEFYATGWEILSGLETRTLEIHKVIECWQPQEFICFKEYVDTFFALRQEAKNNGDEIKRLAYKYLLNSGYGKFAQNPRDFKEYCLAVFGDNPGEEWDWETDYGNICLWSKPTFDGRGFYDVATGASITGFQRANLWRAICKSSNVYYCDTDAIICEASEIERGERLGQWKLEGTCSQLVIAGKKLYGVRWENGEFKIASKGARLTYAQLLQIAKGESVKWTNEAPNFSITLAGDFTKRARFVSREIIAT